MEPLPRFVPPDRAITFSDGVSAVVVPVFGLINLFATLVIERTWSRIAAMPEVHKGPRTAMLAVRIRIGVRSHFRGLPSGDLE